MVIFRSHLDPSISMALSEILLGVNVQPKVSQFLSALWPGVVVETSRSLDLSHLKQWTNFEIFYVKFKNFKWNVRKSAEASKLKLTHLQIENFYLRTTWSNLMQMHQVYFYCRFNIPVTPFSSWKSCYISFFKLMCDC